MARETLPDPTPPPPPPGETRRIEPYLGYGTPQVLRLMGRVHRGAGVGAVRADDHWRRNLWNTIRRIRARGASGVRVLARFQGRQWEARTDARGYFEIEMPLEAPVAAGRWHAVVLALADEAGAGAEPVEARVLVPPTDAGFGVISDIDDTVVHTNAASLLQMLRIVFLKNAHSRLPFDHVDMLYRALQAGPEERSANPIFYVSSSPWNLYDLLEEFFRVHGIPAGPLFLREWDFSPRKLLRMGHQAHKLERIHRLFEFYPAMRWVLIGDSGQEDPEIYREVVRQYPGRVLAIYIRDVTTAERDRAVHAIVREARDLGVEMLLVEEKSDAAVDAAARGLISPHAVERMQRQESTDPA